MIRHTVKTLLQGVLTIALLLVIVFFATHWVGDPVRMMVTPGVSEEVINERKAEFGLDKPLPEQFGKFAADAVRLDFGSSLWLREPAVNIVLNRLPNTAVLAVTAMLIAFVLGVGLGVLAAVRRNSWFDRITNVGTMGAVASVDFWVALMLIVVGAVWWDIFPTSGFGYGRHLVLPAIALALRPLGRIAQIARTATLEQLDQDYVLAARARGTRERIVVVRHVVRNALIAVVTLTGWEFARMFTGTAVIVETIFGWPGIGSLATQALFRHDYPLILAVTVVGASVVIAVHLLVDLLYAAIDPRIRYQEAGS